MVNHFRCIALIGTLVWANNVHFTEETTLEEAIAFADRGLDDGLLGAMIVMPQNDDCASWLSYYGYLNLVMQRNLNI